MRRILGLVMLLMLWSEKGYAPFQVGNGGDYLRIIFEQSRTRANTIAQKMTPLVVGRLDASADVKSWIVENHLALASDILLSQYRWSEQPELAEQATCALTHQPSIGEQVPNAAPIHLSFALCRTHVKTVRDATFIAIHESVHHFGIGDETFADQVALAMVSAWERGLLNWVPVAAGSNGPAARYYHAAEWDGKKIWIYGGLRGNEGQEVEFNDLYSYDLNANAWQKWEIPGLPARHRASLIAIGNDELLVWGGFALAGPSSRAWQNNGLIINTRTKTSTPLAFAGDPFELSEMVVDYRAQTTVWTGKEVLIFGGSHQGTALGYRYDPSTRKLSRLEGLSEASIRRSGHSAVWTGDEMVVWGGMSLDGEFQRSGQAYHLGSGAWRTLSTASAPAASMDHTAVWTGESMLTFGGRVYGSSAEGVRKDLKGTVGIYDPKADRWQSLASDLAIHRSGHSAAWSGAEMLIWGGHTQHVKTYFNSVLGFDPHEKRWRGLSSSHMSERRDHAGVWTGTHLFVWGGRSGRNGEVFQDGAIFVP